MEVRQSPGDTGWFVHDRFGLFIHWGLYALPARHEWVMQKEEIPVRDYERYMDYFDPDLYDPDRWAEAAAGAGMKYFVATTKHHDGFCLWDSALTDYKATNAPAGRDLIRPMVDAFRARGLRVGLYHSIIDWHHPEFVIDDVHALRNHPQRAALNEQRDQSQYIEYLHGQVRELLTGFGRIDVLWCDFSYPDRGKGRDDWDSPRLYRMIRECSRTWCSTTASTWTTAGTSAPRSSGSRRAGSPSTASRWCGRRVRPSPVPGDITATKHPGRASASWCACSPTRSARGQPVAQRRPDRARRVRPPRPRPPAGNGRVDARARPVDLRLHRGAGRVRAAGRLPAYVPPGQQAPVRPPVRVAVSPPAPARLRRQGSLRAVAERRLGGAHAGGSASTTSAWRASRRTPWCWSCRCCSRTPRCRSSSCS